jgi:uncharacterized membrane protein YdjX (TVP38/TMEM64 family)
MKINLKRYLPIIVMLVVALTAGILIWLDILHVDQIIAAVNDNRPLALLVILALFAFKGCSCIPYAVILIGCALIFELPLAIAINTFGTAVCISVSYLIGRFSEGLTLDGVLAKYPKFRRYFANAENYSFTFVFAVHTLHLSTEVQGVLFGLLRTPYWAYLGGSMLALMPSMLVFTVIGDEFDFTNPLFWLFIGIDALMVITGLIYAKKKIIDGGRTAPSEG